MFYCVVVAARGVTYGQDRRLFWSSFLRPVQMVQKTLQLSAVLIYSLMQSINIYLRQIKDIMCSFK